MNKVEKQRVRVEDAIKNLAVEIDKLRLRKMQADMHKCAAKCCENTEDSMERVHGCVESCSLDLTRAQHLVQSELEGFQNRLQRCVLQCNDEAKDKMGAKPTDSQVRMYTKEFEACAVKCVDKHVALVPSMLKKMNEQLSKPNLQAN